MKAIGFTQHLSINDSGNLLESEESIPVPKGHDLLVRINAVFVNPVGVGIRRGEYDKLTAPKVIGWDAYEIMKKMGNQVSLFNPEDRVYHAGSFKRPGSSSGYQLVDERIVGYVSKSLNDDEVAAVSLISLITYEALFEQLLLSSNSQSNKNRAISITNGAGGVGSATTQLTTNAGLTVTATASRPESINWVKSHGAEYTVNHRNGLVDEVRELGYKLVDYILGLKDIDNHWKEMCELIKPEGAIASIAENKRPISLRLLTQERAIFAWEWMYTKPYYHTNDMQIQRDVLGKITYFPDSSQLKYILTHSPSPLNATNLWKAYSLVESGHMVDKVVVSGWEE